MGESVYYQCKILSKFYFITQKNVAVFKIVVKDIQGEIIIKYIVKLGVLDSVFSDVTNYRPIFWNVYHLYNVMINGGTKEIYAIYKILTLLCRFAQIILHKEQTFETSLECNNLLMYVCIFDGELYDEEIKI